MEISPAPSVRAPSQNLNLCVRNKDPVAKKLLALCTKLAPQRRRLTAFQDAMLGEYCVACACEDPSTLTQSLYDALKVLLKARRYDLVLLLFEKLNSLAPQKVLRDAAGILPVAMAWFFEEEGRWKRRYCADPDDFTDVVQLLVDKGADVNAFDNHGNTPIFYACMLGNYQLFCTLLRHGALISTTHTFFSWRWLKATNLLKATLEAFVWDENLRPSRERHPEQEIENRWRRIVGDLLDAGQRAAGDDPRMVQLLQTACLQGDITWVKRLIEYGVPVDAPSTTNCRRTLRGRFYTSSLHAAAAGGHSSVVQLLLNCGARPLDNGLSKCAQNLKGFVERKTLEQTALAVAIDEARRASEESPRKSKLWETCLVLMEVESLPEDLVKLLELSARDGQVPLAKRLLQMGYRLSQVPRTRSFEMIQLLIQHDSRFDPRGAQQLAVREGDYRLLCNLFRKWGNLVAFDDPRWPLLAGPGTVGIGFLDAILSIHNVNDIFHLADGKETTLVQMECRRGSRASVEFLLGKGANLYLPDSGNNALTTLKDRLTTERMGPLAIYQRHGAWELFQLLERHMPDEGQKIRGRCRIKAQGHMPVRRGASRKSPESRPCPTGTDTRLRLPMGRTDVEDFQHTPLSEHDTFRTMILHPAKDPGALIECELVQYALCLAPEYEALSYVWGNNGVPRHIRLDHKDLEITSSLYDALLALRRESDPRLLWVDAVCINQRDTEERNRQVTLMGDIYMNASRVLIWLGTAGEESHLVFQHIEKLRQHREHVMSFRTPRRSFGRVVPCSFPMRAEAIDVAIQRLFQRPWFFRTWVIQEKGLSKEATICCGPDSASWKEVYLLLSEDTFNDSTSYHPIHGLDYERRAHDLHQLSLLTSSRKLLGYSRDCQAADPRDRVYGILGLLKPGLIKVNYELDVQEIYRSFTQAIIQDEDSIQILNLCGTRHSLPDLPSWVPDFSVGRSSCHLSGLEESGGPDCMYWDTDHLKTHLTKVLPGLEFRDNGKKLLIKGKAIDTVRAVGDEMPVSKEYAHGTEKLSRIISGWETLTIRNAPTQELSTYWNSGDPQSSVSNVFLETLIALNDDNQEFMPIGGVIWYQQHGTGSLLERECQYFEDVECDTILNNKVDFRGYNKFSQSYDWYIQKLEQVVYGRKLFVTEGGVLGLGDPELQPGDKVVFLPGAPHPFAIRDFDGDAFTLLGDCYVHGFHARKLFEDHEQPIRDYVFR